MSVVADSRLWSVVLLDCSSEGNLGGHVSDTLQVVSEVCFICQPSLKLFSVTTDARMFHWALTEVSLEVRPQNVLH